jgi:transposase
MLDLPGVKVSSVELTEDGVIVGLVSRVSGHRCPCGTRVEGRYDQSRRRWRHLDMMKMPVWLEADIARIACPACERVRTEEVPWARPSARHSRDFEDVVGWLAQRLDKTAIASLMRCSWRAVNRIVMHVVDEHLDERRLDGLVNIGVDEVSYKRGHQYLTIVADHDTGRVVYVAKGASGAALTEFFSALGSERCKQIKGISMDMASRWTEAVRTAIPKATVCFDPFHIIKWANDALNAVYTASARAVPFTGGVKAWRRTRRLVRTGSEHLDAQEKAVIRALRRARRPLFDAWELKERLRDLYRIVPPDRARAYLHAWIEAARASGLRPFINLANRFTKYFDGIVAAVEYGLSNSRLEGINSKIRLINRRAHGHRTPESLTAMIYLCLGGITICLPTQT